MSKIFSPSFWIQAFISTFITMMMIYLIKRISSTVNIPIVSDVAQAV